MKIVILQPSYLPWLGYFDQIARCDRFVFLDDVQFTRRDWRNRNKIRTRDGWMWLTVPVAQKHHFAQSLLETRIDNSTPWAEKHLAAIRHNYCKAPYFDLYFPELERLLRQPWEGLADLCRAATLALAEKLGIHTPTMRSSEMPIAEKKAEKILAICRQLGASHYLTGDLARNYLQAGEFLRYNISLEYHEYQHPEYRQRFPGFLPYMSVIDLLFNEGEKSAAILTRNVRTGG